MKHITRRSKLALALALALTAAPFALGQQGAGGAPGARNTGRSAGSTSGLGSSLDDLLAAALRSNPDVLLAEARVREAEAQLNQARLKVIQDTVALYHKRRSADAMLGHLAAQLDSAKRRHESGQATQENVTKAYMDVAGAEADRALVEAQLEYVTGIGARTASGIPGARRTGTTGTVGRGAMAPGPGSPGGAPGVAAPRRHARPPVPEKLAPALETPITVEFSDAALRDVLQHVRSAGGLNIILHSELQEIIESDVPTISVLLSDVTLRDFLDAVADTAHPDICFVMREYGVIVATRNVARYLSGATIPEGIPYEPEE